MCGINAIYAFHPDAALVDAGELTRTREAMRTRGPDGIKPLYYANDGGTIRVASQVKALLAGGGVSRTSDSAGIAGFLLRGFVPEPFTTYEAIQSLPAGSWMSITASGASVPQSYFS